jgi:fructose-bisphosphate aldolase class I
MEGALPSSACMAANTHALGRYAALRQAQGLVPIVKPEVLMNGSHTIERCEEVSRGRKPSIAGRASLGRYG